MREERLEGILVIRHHLVHHAAGVLGLGKAVMQHNGETDVGFHPLRPVLDGLPVFIGGVLVLAVGLVAAPEEIFQLRIMGRRAGEQIIQVVAGFGGPSHLHGQHGQRPAEVVPIRAPHGLRQDEKGPQLEPTRLGRLGLLVDDQAVFGEGVAVVGVQAEVTAEIPGGLGVVADLLRGRGLVLERGGGAPPPGRRADRGRRRR